tara:strand:+ start:605 stop:1090 length:486 start_codon:yes stop_codon:yes gene_type:complete
MVASQTKNIAGLAAFLALSFVVSGIGGAITASSVGTWYQTLIKPPFNPPDWLFAPVWTTLFVLMAVAGWRVWRKVGFSGASLAFAAYGFQLALNLTWSGVFFGLQLVGWALVEMVVFFVAIIATGWLFRPVDKLAAFLFVPYGLWVAFALALNTAIWILNS